MASYAEELIDTARHLLVRQPKQRGRLPTARVRRSISTSYYALFHFLLDQVSYQLVGSTNDVRRRRHVFARVLTHIGINAALERVKGANVDSNVANFMRSGIVAGIPVPSPDFARKMAGAFAGAQAARHFADYDRNYPIIAENAVQVLDRVEEAIAAWTAANTASDRDFKKALSLLITLRGKLRSD
ncbi:MAG: hypothetical protein RL367_2598 [Pseudomonadota bacterium]